MNNAINKFFLWIVLLPIGLYERMGINTRHLRAILIAKLIIDDRRPNTFQQSRPNRKGTVNMATLGTMLISALLGLFYLIAFSIVEDKLFQLTLYFSMFIFMLASSVITDFTSVLIDIKDNFIILPKPVSDKTVVTARLLHILIHMSKLILPMMLPGVVYVAYNSGVPGVLMFMLLMILAALLTIFIVNAVYILILKVTSPQKFQQIISNFQIVFAIVLYGSYQIVPRMLDDAAFREFDIAEHQWFWLIPPYWFANAWLTITTATFTTAGIISLLITLILPVFSIYIVIKYLAPSFNQKLSLINSSNAEQNVSTASPKNVNTSKAGLLTKIASLLNKKGAETMSFLFTWKMTGRSKDFKLKVYPGIGYLVVLLAVILFKSKKSFAEMAQDIEAMEFGFVAVVYFSSFLLITAIGQVSYSDKFKAAWIYYSTPVAVPGELISGALKATIMKFYMPIVAITTIAAIILVGPSILPNLVLGLFNQLLICFTISYMTIRELPFSMQQNTNLKSGTFLRGVLSLIIPGIVALLHYFVHTFTAVVWIFAVMSIIATWLVSDSIKKTGWVKINVVKGE